MDPHVVAPAALAATLLVSGCSGSATPETTPSPTSTTQVTVSPPARLTLAENKADAVRAAKRALRTMPMPSGSRRLRHSPVPDLAHQNEGIGPSDPRLQQKAWWTVPLAGTTFLEWLRHHHPDGMRLQGGADGGTIESGGRIVHTAEYDGRSTAAHTGVVLLLEYQSTATGTAIRGSTWVSARRPRPASTHVEDVISVDVSWEARETMGRHRVKSRTRHLDSTAPADRRPIARLVKVVNDLVGSPVPPPMGSCPMLLVAAVDKVTFEMGGDTGPHTLTFRLEPGCFGQVSVNRDGARLSVTLDPGRFATVVPRVVRAPR